MAGEYIRSVSSRNRSLAPLIAPAILLVGGAGDGKMAGGAEPGRRGDARRSKILVVDRRDQAGETGSDLVSDLQGNGFETIWEKHVDERVLQCIRCSEVGGAFVHLGAGFGSGGRLVGQLRSDLEELPIVPYTASPLGPDPAHSAFLDSREVLWSDTFRRGSRSLAAAMLGLSQARASLEEAIAASGFPRDRHALDPDPIDLDGLLVRADEVFVRYAVYGAGGCTETAARWLGIDESTLRGWITPKSKDFRFDLRRAARSDVEDVLQTPKGSIRQPFLLVLDDTSDGSDLSAIGAKHGVSLMHIAHEVDLNRVARLRPRAAILRVGRERSPGFGFLAALAMRLEAPEVPFLLWTDSRHGGSAEPAASLGLLRRTVLRDPAKGELLPRLLEVGLRAEEFEAAKDPYRFPRRSAPPNGLPARMDLRSVRRRLDRALVAAARRTYSEKSAAARALMLSRRALDRRLAKYGIE